MTVAWVVLAAWLLQASVGVVLAWRWWRAVHRLPAIAVVHTLAGVLGLALWIGFLATREVAPAWGALLTMTVGNALGDTMLRDRSRAVHGRTTFWRDYGVAVMGTLRGVFPRAVNVHALFAGVVYFSCLAACLIATFA